MRFPYCLIVTIAAWQHRRAKELLDSLQKEGLDDTVINVGPVQMNYVPALYSQCDALLMPTLLESFSGTYVEAMYHRKVILTSNLDFAEDVCGEAAFYFDPLDVDSISDAINLAFGDDELRMQRIEEGARKLNEMPDWKQVFEKYQYVLQNIIN